MGVQKGPKYTDVILEQPLLSNSIECVAPYIIQAVRVWGFWRQESRMSGRGRSRRRSTVADLVLVVSNQNRCAS